MSYEKGARWNGVCLRTSLFASKKKKKKAQVCQPFYAPATQFVFYINTGKNPTYAQAKIKLFSHNTVYCVKAAFCWFC